MRRLHVGIRELRVTGPHILRFIAGLFLVLAVWAPSAQAHPPAEHPAEAVHEETTAPEQQAEGAVDHGATHDHAGPDREPGAPHEDQHDHGAPAGAAESGHAHWGDNGPQTAFERAMARLGVLHSVAVHFPIALLMVAALAQILTQAGLPGGNVQTVRFLVWTGALGGVAAGFLGWAHAGPMTSGEDGVMLAHRVLGTALAVGLTGLVGLVEWNARRPGRIVGLLTPLAVYLAGLGAAINGFLGGSLAHGGIRHLIGS